jgi:hypothetical protein
MKPLCASLGAPHGVLPFGSALSSTGSSRCVPRLPRYYGAVRLPGPLGSDSLAFARPYPALRLCFAPSGPGRPTAGLGFLSRSPLPAKRRREASRASQVPRQPPVPLPCSPTPAGPDTPGPLRCASMAPAKSTTKAPTSNPSFEAQSHGFRTSCLRFVRCIATPDAKLASGCWPSFTGWAWLPTGLW